MPDEDQREDLHLAASEIAANAFRHGVRPVSARVWADGDRLICVITDRGTAYADPLVGFAPAHGLDLSHGGMGLWLARKLWDHVDLLPGPDGLTVRLSTGCADGRRAPSPAPAAGRRLTADLSLLRYSGDRGDGGGWADRHGRRPRRCGRAGERGAGAGRQRAARARS